jgi:hypothetical protein
MNCYDGTRGVEEVWIHGHFDLLSLRDLIRGVAVNTGSSAARALR